MNAPDIPGLRRLPSVDEVLRSEPGLAAVAQFGRPAALAAMRACLDAPRACAPEILAERDPI